MASPSSLPPPAVDVRIDEVQGRVRVRITGEATGAQVWRALSDLLGRRPETTGFDFLVDLREYRGDVQAQDVHNLAPLYQRLRVPEADGVRTSFLTFDPNFVFWAEAMNHHFPGRRHGVFRDEMRAEAFLDTPRPERRDAHAGAGPRGPAPA